MVLVFVVGSDMDSVEKKMKKWEVSAPVSRATEVCKTQAGWTFYSPRCTALWQDTADPSNDSKTPVASLAAETLPGFK